MGDGTTAGVLRCTDCRRTVNFLTFVEDGGALCSKCYAARFPVREMPPTQSCPACAYLVQRCRELEETVRKLETRRGE